MYAPPWIDPWLPLARFTDVLAKLADIASNVYPQAALYELGFRVAGVMLRHPAFIQHFHTYVGGGHG